MRTLILFFAFCVSATASFAQTAISPARPGVTYGKEITGNNAISAELLSQKLKSDSVYTGKVSGKVTEVCKKKGCFMKISREGAEPILIRFKDYAFFMPQNIVGKTVIVEGKAVIKETSVVSLKHWAKDAGKSEADIAMITKPEFDVQIMADGVLVVE